MKYIHTLLFIMIGSCSSIHTGWHEWSAKFETPQNDSLQKCNKNPYRKAYEEGLRKGRKAADIDIRKHRMVNFRLGRLDPNSVVSTLPMDIIDHIHLLIKKAEENSEK